MIAALYLRVSTDEQADRQLPIESQEAACRDLCRARGWEVYEPPFVDEGISGKLGPRHRPGLARLLGEAEAGAPFGVVVAWKRNRLARRRHLYGHLAYRLEEAGISIVPTVGGDGDLEETFEVWKDARFVQDLAEDTRRSIRRLAERGEWTGGQPLFGYRWEGVSPKRARLLGIPPVPRRRVIVPEKAAIVRALYSRADPDGEAASISELARYFSEATGAKVNPGRVRDLLRHPGYVGAYVHRAGAGRHRDRWPIVIPGRHPPIVDEALWGRVQARLDEQARSRERVGAGFVSLPMTGLLRCGSCGRIMRVVCSKPSAAGLRHSYACPAGHLRVPVFGWPEAVLEAAIGRLLEPGIAEAIASAVNRALRAERASTSSEEEVRSLERSQESILAVIRTGTVADPAGLGRELDRVQKALEAARAEQARVRSVGRVLLSPATVRAALRASLEGRGALRADRPTLHRLVERIEVLDRDRAKVILRGEVGGAGPELLGSKGRRSYPPLVLEWRKPCQKPKRVSPRRGSSLGAATATSSSSRPAAPRPPSSPRSRRSSTKQPSQSPRASSTPRRRAGSSE